MMATYQDDAEFYVVHIASENLSDSELSNVEKKFNLAYDWFRVDSGFYILYSSKNSSTWYTRIGKLFETKPNMFFCRLDISDRQGWMTKSFWEWIKEKKPPAER
ncbi:hypothetical protein JK203_11500 [Gluconobacter cerinus]|uniref:hypothetical protein n=1 Tax=Gluconobacter cerinus TaxID=38307 RepID=UPI001B8B6D31|nr:hypothetical protein [Gluconobacter cerinus]MBS1041463.1 hypothetical protein [Gluconobacter cerinus]MBS1048051.1 hypothetical protein [Gluconobacter cerinus]